MHSTWRQINCDGNWWRCDHCRKNAELPSGKTPEDVSHEVIEAALLKTGYANANCDKSR